MKAVVQNGVVTYDEINLHIDARCVTPPEAMWRLLGKGLFRKSHSVQKLDIHLSGGRVKKHSTLDAYFTLNSEDAFARTLFYSQIPEHYVFRGGRWKKRERQQNVVASIYSVSPAQCELYHLRLLLLYVKGVKSFEELYVYEGSRCATYAIACLRRGITNGSAWKHENSFGNPVF